MSKPAGRLLLLLVGMSATATAVGFAVYGPAAPSTSTSISIKCPAGESEDLFTGVCIPELAPSLVEITTADFGGPPQIDGVPCTGGNSYECIGLAEEQLAAGPTPSAKSTLTAQSSVEPHP